MENVSRETDRLTLRLQRNIRRKSLKSPGIDRRETFMLYWFCIFCTLFTFFHILLSSWINFGSMECMISIHPCIMYECVCVPDDVVWAFSFWFLKKVQWMLLFSVIHPETTFLSPHYTSRNNIPIPTLYIQKQHTYPHTIHPETTFLSPHYTSRNNIPIPTLYIQKQHSYPQIIHPETTFLSPNYTSRNNIPIPKLYIQKQHAYPHTIPKNQLVIPYM